MDGAVTKEEAAARWQRDLEEAEVRDEQTWPGDTTARMSEFERLTLLTEILMPMRNELALEFEETRRRHEPPSLDPMTNHGDGGEPNDKEEYTAEPAVNQVYSVVLAAAATCNRWLREDLRPELRTGRQDFETSMTLDPATDIDRWARERAQPLMEEPASDDIERWLHWADVRTAGTLPEETAPRDEWSEAVGHSLALVREAVHRLTLARLQMRTGDQAMLESNVAVQITENLYRVVVWLASTMQAWGLALVRVHSAAPEPDEAP